MFLIKIKLFNIEIDLKIQIINLFKLCLQTLKKYNVIKSMVVSAKYKVLAVLLINFF